MIFVAYEAGCIKRKRVIRWLSIRRLIHNSDQVVQAGIMGLEMPAKPAI